LKRNETTLRQNWGKICASFIGTRSQAASLLLILAPMWAMKFILLKRDETTLRQNWECPELQTQDSNTFIILIY
jgi:hypothetical protein